MIGLITCIYIYINVKCHQTILHHCIFSLCCSSCRYAVNLKEAQRYGVKKGFFTGAGTGVLFFIIFSCYALAFWYGAKLVREDGYTVGQLLVVSIIWFHLFPCYINHLYNSKEASDQIATLLDGSLCVLLRGTGLESFRDQMSSRLCIYCLNGCTVQCCL